MMIDEPKGGQYGTGFERCAEGWRLYERKTEFFNALDSCGLSQMAWDKWAEAQVKYSAHVRDCPECLAVKGRFAEAE